MLHIIDMLMMYSFMVMRKTYQSLLVNKEKT
jgi:hypothetical protein